MTDGKWPMANPLAIAYLGGLLPFFFAFDGCMLELQDWQHSKLSPSRYALGDKRRRSSPSTILLHQQGMQRFAIEFFIRNTLMRCRFSSSLSVDILHTFSSPMITLSHTTHTVAWCVPFGLLVRIACFIAFMTSDFLKFSSGGFSV